MSRQIIAVVGDVHGEMRAMIRLLSGWEKRHRQVIDAVLQVGDFEPHTTAGYLATMAAPAKYRKMGDFSLLASGQAEFPQPVHFIGGNHEPYGLLDQTPRGAELAPNCNYLGRVGLSEICGLRVAFLSGIFVPHLFGRERPGVADFITRANKEYVAWNEADIEKLLEVGRADVLLLHEWPEIPYGDRVRDEAESGMRHLELALESLRPRRIFCGHTHFAWSGRWRGARVKCLARIDAGRDGFLVYEVEGEQWRVLE